MLLPLLLLPPLLQLTAAAGVADALRSAEDADDHCGAACANPQAAADAEEDWVALLQVNRARGSDLVAEPAKQRRTGIDHHWPHVRGKIPGQYGTTNYIGPRNLSANLEWTWHHPLGRYYTVIGGGPVIDVDRFIYMSTNDAVRKYSPEGPVLWEYRPPGPGDIGNGVSLLDDRLYLNTNGGKAICLDIYTGTPIWIRDLGTIAKQDVAYPSAYDDVCVMGINESADMIFSEHGLSMIGGNQEVVGLNATTGADLWRYRPDKPVWNLMTMFPGDDTLVFMDYTGTVYKLGLHDGSLKWKTPVPYPGNESFTDGGVILGVNGMAYSCSQANGTHGMEGDPGLLRALRLDDGVVMWQQVLPMPCLSWPAVDHLGGPGLSVVVNVGSFRRPPGGFTVMPPGYEMPPENGGIMVFDAATGVLQYKYRAPTWNREFIRGDPQGYARRLVTDPLHAFCLPAPWTAPTIAGDFTIYAGRLDGYLYEVRAPAAEQFENTMDMPPPDFSTTPGVVTVMTELGSGFMAAGTAWAPGLMVVADCDTLFVYKFAEW